VNFYNMYKLVISDTQIQFGLFVKLHRLLKKMSQPELGNEVNISKTHISRIENGEANITITNIINLCNFLEINYSKVLVKLSAGETAEIEREINILEIESKNQKKKKS